MTTEFIQKATGLPEDTIVKVMDAFVDFIKSSMKDGNQVEMTGFGVFSFKDFDERPGRNPRTGESITIAPKRKPTFKFSKKFVESISLSPSSTMPLAPPTAPPTHQRPTPPPLVTKTWYLADAAGSFSEVPEHELKAKGLTASSMLWSAETDWKKASDIPALAYLLS
ncbi:HU family DNA-binding protein [Microcoleus sp. bin38.metabat.b11b12b14.051]|uniref:HU family DNA-binding protein n=1 Tax=Microcoleus sp. bin38.metabat.b11b12b14.051 TaxID=2742709 RepID=UPI0025ED68BB|nr:HU family DNA-binding protein [Microcoleus sp. bin38.metabat.b11b12b14.051]